MTKDEAITGAVKLRDDIAREFKRCNGKTSRKAAGLIDASAKVVSAAFKAGYGVAVLDAMRSRPLPADVMPDAAE